MHTSRFVTHLRTLLITTLIIAGSVLPRLAVHAQGDETQSSLISSPSLSVPPAGRDLSAPAVPPEFQDTVVFSGLEEPTTVEFSPDGRVFVAEKSGIIKVFDSLTDTAPDVFADLRTNVHNFWDRGLLGLALHPDFPTTPYVYVLYAHDAAIGGTAPRWGTVGETSDPCPQLAQGCVISGRLSRLQASGNQMIGTEELLIEDWFQQFQAHSVAGLAFGPDNALYVTGGDGASFNYADWGQDGNPGGDPPTPGASLSPPTAEGGALRSQDFLTRTDPLGLTGTLIRVDGAGAPMSNNPLAADPELNARRMIAHGLRMPFRLAFRPGTNELWVAETGWNQTEEINRVAVPTGPVQNFGWPCYEGAAHQAGYDGANLNLCEQLYNTPGAVTAPHYSYNHGAPVVAGDGCGEASASISGIAFNDGTRFPAEYNGALFFADYARQCIWVLRAGANGLPDPATVAVFGPASPNPVDLKFHDGDLYYIDIHGGAVHRIRHFSGNTPPTAVAETDRIFGPAPLTVNFDGRDSTDPDGETLTYAWDLDGDGAFDDGTTAQVSFTYATAGTVRPALQVTDPFGASNVQRLTVLPGQLGPPVAAISSPVASLQWTVGETISFSGSATDPDQQGALPASALTWSLIMHHCPGGCHTHVIQNFAEMSSGSFVAPDHEYPSHLELQLTATDATGLQATTSVLLQPATVGLSFDSAPTGIPLAVLQTSHPTPFTTNLLRGGSISISAPPAHVVGNQFYRFQSWSDGGAASHNIGPVLGSQPYIATYAAATDITAEGTPIALITAPQGTGNPNIEVIRDNVFPDATSMDPLVQYDTFTGDTTRALDWIGYEFATPRRFVGLTFQEGRQFVDGGWFEALAVEVRINGVWTPVSGFVSSPAYPGANGVSFETFALSFTPVVGEAIRIVGPPGGTMRFVSVGELRALAEEIPAPPPPTASFTISPPTGVYTWTQSFDLALTFDLLGRTIAGGSVTFDGVDVTGALLSCIVPGAGPSGLATLRCPGLGGPVVGPGTHVLTISITLDDGSQIGQSVTWTVLPVGGSVEPPPSFTISPPTGTYLSTQSFDIALAFDLAGRAITTGSATFDGLDVTGVLASCMMESHPFGLVTLRCPDIGGPVIGPGTHAFDVTLVLSDGTELRRAVMWTVVPVVEP